MKIFFIREFMYVPFPFHDFVVGILSLHARNTRVRKKRRKRSRGRILNTFRSAHFISHLKNITFKSNSK